MTEWKGEMDKSTVVVGDFNFSLLVINTIREKRNEKIHRRLE